MKRKAPSFDLIADQALVSVSQVSPQPNDVVSILGLHQNSAAPTAALNSRSNYRAFKLVELEPTSITFEVMFYRGGIHELRPLVILNSVEYPVPPSEQFCAHLWAAGYQVIYVRRPGFGRTTCLPDALLHPDQIKNSAAVATEAALLSKLIDKLSIKNVTLMARGSANPVAYRLCILSPAIGLSVFVNPAFNQDVYEKFDPDWIKSMLGQLVSTRGGLSISIRGLKAVLKTRPHWLYRQVADNSQGDLRYIDENQSDITQSALALQSMSPSTVFYEFSNSLNDDPLLRDGLFEEMNTVAVSAHETRPDWLSGLGREADRLAVPLELAELGNYFVPYATPTFLINILQKYDLQKSA